MSNVVMNKLFSNHDHLLKTFNQYWLAPNQLDRYAAAIHIRGAPLDFSWGFVDGTVRPEFRSGQDQQVLYNGHKRVHSIKFQSVVAPNGLIANLFGPVGCRHDS